MPEPISRSIELRGQRLILRPYRPGDAARLLAAVRESVGSVGRWLPWCHAGYDEADAETWIAHCAEGWDDGSHYAFAAYEAASGEFCGAAGLNLRNREHNFMNLGYWVRATRQGRGVAREAARLVADFGFDQLGLTRIEIITAPQNAASRRVAEALGAVFEGIARNRIVIPAGPLDARVYSLVPASADTAGEPRHADAQTCSTSS